MMNRNTRLNQIRPIEKNNVYSENPDQDYLELQNNLSLASRLEGFSIWTYYLKEKKIVQKPFLNSSFGINGDIFNVPKVFVEKRIIHKDDVKNLFKLFDKNQQGEHFVTENIRINSYGEWHWYAISLINVYDKNNKPYKAIGLTKDITTKIETEKKILGFQSLKRLAYKNTIATFSFNLSKNWCGDGKSEIASLLKMQERGTVDAFFECAYSNLEDCITLKQYKKLFNRRHLLSLYNDGQTTPSFEHLYCLDGVNSIWVRTVVDMIENPRTRDIEALFYAININKEKEYKDIINNMVKIDYEFVCTIDVKTSEIIVYSTSNENLFAVPVNSSKYNIEYDIKLRNMLKEEDLKDALVKMRLDYVITKLKNKNKYTRIYPVIEKDKIKYKKWQFSYLNKGKFINEGKNKILLTRTDVTEEIMEEIHKKEEIEKALQETERANNSKIEFFNRISHDMRTPMNGILGLLNICKDLSKSEEMDLNLKKIEDASRYLLALINDTLDLSKIEGGKIESKQEKVDFNKFLSSILNILEINAKEKNISLEYDIPEFVYEVMIDKFHFEQIIINIISNAIKFTNESGIIEVDVMEEFVENILKARIVIKDNGVGISKDYLPKIFEPFSQEDNMLTGPNSGAGLGLAIVSRLIKLMNGKIEIESEKNKGTKVMIDFDFVAVEERLIGCLEGDNYSLRCRKPNDINYLQNKKILVFEDNEINCEIVKYMLEKVGCVADFAKNGEIGLDMYRNSKINYYDAILMDIMMPVMDGNIASNKIRYLSRFDAQRIPIIAMTANYLEQDIKKSRLSGMNDHLAKPLEPDVLYQTLLKYI